MNCQHPRIKRLADDEAFCFKCFNTINLSSVPLDLQRPGDSQYKRSLIDTRYQERPRPLQKRSLI